MTYTPAEKFYCAERERKIRERVYKGRVMTGRMTQASAAYETAVMAEIAEDYKKLMDKGRLI